MIDRNGKAQWIRAADVVLIGPLMVFGGFALHDRSAVAGWALGAFGIATVLFNGYNLVHFARRSV